MAGNDRQYLQGTLEILVLKTLTWGPMHGFGIGAWLEEGSGRVLRIEEGSLYPALHRMERRGWIESEWRVTEKGRRAKYYRLTREGRRRLRTESREWSRFAGAVGGILGGAKSPAWARGA